MNRLIHIMKPLVPVGARRFVRRLMQKPPPKPVIDEAALRDCIERLLKLGAAGAADDPDLLSELLDAWGNRKWSADEGYLRLCLVEAARTKLPVLECGSGVTSLALAAACRDTGKAIWSLENNTQWGAKVQRMAGEMNLTNLNVAVQPLRDYGDFVWYDPPLERMPQEFGVVVCDGPPGSTKGGRSGMVPIMKERLSATCVILMDDVNRENERAIAERWGEELTAELDFSTASEAPDRKSYARLLRR